VLGIGNAACYMAPPSPALSKHHGKKARVTDVSRPPSPRPQYYLGMPPTLFGYRPCQGPLPPSGRRHPSPVNVAAHLQQDHDRKTNLQSDVSARCRYSVCVCGDDVSGYTHCLARSAPNEGMDHHQRCSSFSRILPFEKAHPAVVEKYLASRPGGR
jgi:hypothetical protein